MGRARSHCRVSSTDYSSGLVACRANTWGWPPDLDYTPNLRHPDPLHYTPNLRHPDPLHYTPNLRHPDPLHYTPNLRLPGPVE